MKLDYRCKKESIRVTTADQEFVIHLKASKEVPLPTWQVEGYSQEFRTLGDALLHIKSLLTITT